MLVPANNNGDLYCRVPTLVVSKAAIIVSPLVSLVGSRMRKLGTGNIGTTTLGDVGSRTRGFQIEATYLGNRLGLLCVSPRHLVRRLPFLVGSVGISLFTVSRTRYVSR